MKITIDQDANAAYLELKNGKVFETRTVGKCVNADLNEAGEVMGIEFYSQTDVDINSINIRYESARLVKKGRNFKPETIKGILGELQEQCQKVIGLIDSYDLEGKTQDEKDDMIVNMSVNVNILAVRSGLIDGYFEEMLEDEEPTEEK